MITQVMVQPSSWVESGIKISKVETNLFKFTDELQSRLDELSEKKKAGFLTSEEEAELTGILELDRIFTLLNARIIAESCSRLDLNDERHNEGSVKARRLWVRGGWHPPDEDPRQASEND